MDRRGVPETRPRKTQVALTLAITIQEERPLSGGRTTAVGFHIWRCGWRNAWGGPRHALRRRETLQPAPLHSIVGVEPRLRRDGHLGRLNPNAGHFTKPVPISATNSPDAISKPVVSKDERTLYFASTRTDGTSKGKGDIWVSTRSNREEEFGLPHAVDELNTASAGEQPIWVSSDGCDIVILRDQSLAMARRPK